MKVKMLIILVVVGFSSIVTLAALGFLPIGGGLLHSVTGVQNSPTNEQLTYSSGVGLQTTQCYLWNGKVLTTHEPQIELACTSFVDHNALLPTDYSNFNSGS